MTDSYLDDGGPAFPAEGGSDSGLYPNPGMSLLDYFAAKAMQSMIDALGGFEGEDVGHIAGCSYEMAEAMLAEKWRRRAKKTP